MRMPPTMEMETATAMPAPHSPECLACLAGHRHRVQHNPGSFICRCATSRICRSRFDRNQGRIPSCRSLRRRRSVLRGTNRGRSPLPQTCSQLDCEIMTAFEPSSQRSPEMPWSVFQALHPIYQALVCEFVIEVPKCPFDADTVPGDDQRSGSPSRNMAPAGGC